MECHHCGVSFPPKADKRYCSETCRKRAELRRWRARTAAHISAHKTERGCLVCGLSGPAYVLELHHRDAATKCFELGDVRGLGRSGVVASELNKCIVLCAVHHRMTHAGDLDPLA